MRNHAERTSSYDQVRRHAAAKNYDLQGASMHSAVPYQARIQSVRSRKTSSKTHPAPTGLMFAQDLPLVTKIRRGALQALLKKNQAPALTVLNKSCKAHARGSGVDRAHDPDIARKPWPSQGTSHVRVTRYFARYAKYLKKVSMTGAIPSDSEECIAWTKPIEFDYKSTNMLADGKNSKLADISATGTLRQGECAVAPHRSTKALTPMLIDRRKSLDPQTLTGKDFASGILGSEDMPLQRGPVR
ncbi:hypothetical protein FVE85_6176 [Porphyridium purpureum]|uniref:Uncharacterized protein n=1 Tax=Porphyridium purpureum TaxID=35688 RepID=A0A5J4Z422_PORPP|nr:hypothetical protein FVE85_6176 [Porphyridium purpureum]|eukprot:POR8419..scf295_1